VAAVGADVILVRPTTDPDDVHGMLAARAVITEIGGTTSHAAVVSRELDRPCVVGCGVGSLMQLIGREITVNATTGEVLDGLLPVEKPSAETDPDLAVLKGWLTTDGHRDHPLASLLAGHQLSPPGASGPDGS
jgi:pyruvate,orthophosphate dikinase